MKKYKLDGNFLQHQINFQTFSEKYVMKYKNFLILTPILIALVLDWEFFIVMKHLKYVISLLILIITKWTITLF